MLPRTSCPICSLHHPTGPGFGSSIGLGKRRCDSEAKANTANVQFAKTWRSTSVKLHLRAMPTLLRRPMCSISTWRLQTGKLMHSGDRLGLTVWRRAWPAFMKGHQHGWQWQLMEWIVPSSRSLWTSASPSCSVACIARRWSWALLLLCLWWMLFWKLRFYTCSLLSLVSKVRFQMCIGKGAGRVP